MSSSEASDSTSVNVSEAPIAKNRVNKPPKWHQRNSYIIRGGSLPSQWVHDGQLRATIVNPQWDVVVPGENGLPFVRCKTFEYYDNNPAAEDGAEIAIQAGKNTPVQYVASETTFLEIPLRGKLIFLSVSPEGKFGRFFFDVSERDNSRYMAMISKGWIMSWYACKDQQDALILESETPGFSQANLPTVADDAKTAGQTQIPKEFWEIVDLLRNGHEEEVLPLCTKK